MKMAPVMSEADLDRFSTWIGAYFAYGGLHIQFNLMDYEILMDARAHPDNYPDLLVRVSGYSAYFRDLNDAMKDEIITRTAYDTNTGEAIPPPGSTVRPVVVSDAPLWEGRADDSTGRESAETRTGMTNPALKLALETLEKRLSTELAEGFLATLLEVMEIAFFFDHNYRKNIEGFAGRYLFRSSDHAIEVSATFANGNMEVAEKAIPDPHVTLIFKDEKALLNFLLSGNPDILGSMLRQDVTPEGNLNYLYKFAYMARRLQLMATGRV
jgi:hypothetical protein